MSLKRKKQRKSQFLGEIQIGFEMRCFHSILEENTEMKKREKFSFVYKSLEGNRMF